MADLPPEPVEPKPKGRRGPPKGTRGGGRAKGTKNKATRERELQARLERERIELADKIVSGATKEVEIVKAQAAGKKLMKDQAFDFAALFASMAAYYQPQPTIVNGVVINLDKNPNSNEEKFKEYAMMASQLAVASAKFQSPSFSAMVVGASVTTKVVVEGGMPNDFDPPAPKGEILDLKPLTVITADEPEPPAVLPKAVNE
jgi:hypothetical protein